MTNDTHRLVVISGLSGSGKTVAIHALEDLGYYCIDNLPAGLIGSLLEKLSDTEGDNRIAVGVDARNRKEDLGALPELLTELNKNGTQTDLLFLVANDEDLLKRYRETRRRHPLEKEGRDLLQTIQRERELLGPVLNAADLVIDTSQTSVYELADMIRKRIDRRKKRSLSILLESFGFKHGMPAGADFVFDLRSLPNPYWDPALRGMNGLDQPVIEFLGNQSLFNAMHSDILNFLQRWIPEYQKANRSYLTVGLGCTGGQHRSVCMTEKLATALRADYPGIHTRHNEISADKE